MSNSAAINFGQCWGRPSGQSLSSPSYLAQGIQCVAEAVADRWSTTNGTLIDDPNYGWNVVDLVSDDLSPHDLAYAGAQLAAEAEKDERVQSMQGAVTFNLGVLTVIGAGQTAAGPFKLIGTVSQFTPLSFLVQA